MTDALTFTKPAATGGAKANLKTIRYGLCKDEKPQAPGHETVEKKTQSCFVFRMMIQVLFEILHCQCTPLISNPWRKLKSLLKPPCSRLFYKAYKAYYPGKMQPLPFPLGIPAPSPFPPRAFGGYLQ